MAQLADRGLQEVRFSGSVLGGGRERDPCLLSWEEGAAGWRGELLCRGCPSWGQVQLAFTSLLVFSSGGLC